MALVIDSINKEIMFVFLLWRRLNICPLRWHTISIPMYILNYGIKTRIIVNYSFENNIFVCCSIALFCRCGLRLTLDWTYKKISGCNQIAHRIRWLLTQLDSIYNWLWIKIMNLKLRIMFVFLFYWKCLEILSLNQYEMRTNNNKLFIQTC